MLTEQILLMLLVAIFSLLLHYYIGVINIWYFSCTEVLVALLLYEIMVSMYKSYAVYSEHIEMQNNARESEILSFDKMTKLNTKINESTSIEKEKELNQLTRVNKEDNGDNVNGDNRDNMDGGNDGDGVNRVNRVNRVNHKNQEKNEKKSRKSHKQNNDSGKKISFAAKEAVVSFPEMEGHNIIKVIEGDEESVSESEISE
jgi:hypothetical protein